MFVLNQVAQPMIHILCIKSLELRTLVVTNYSWFNRFLFNHDDSLILNTRPS